MDLSWTAASDNVGVTGYDVFRCQGTGCSDFTELATLGAVTGYKDTSVAPATSYTYRVRAFDAAGNLGPYADPASATTAAAPDTQPPTKPASLEASASGSDTIGLSWDAATDDRGVSGYQVERCSGQGCTDFTHLADTTDTTYSDSGLTASTEYTYRVRASDAAGNLSAYSDPASATTAAAPDTQPPTKPASLEASASGSDTIGLSWDAATDDRGVSGYQVERCSGQGCTDFTHLADTTDTTYSDSGLTASTEYTYRVRASDAAGNLSAYSDPASATTAAAPDTQPPTKPASLEASASGSDTIGLSWDAATDDRGVSGYQVERCSGQGCTDFTHLADTTDTTYSDSGLTASTEYTYRVRASDAAGNLSAYSDPASATTAASPPAGVGPLRVGPTGRYLVDQNGTPFLIAGDSPQALIGDLSLADAESFFADRQALGFNSVWINLLCTTYTGCRADGSTWDGIAPFTTPGDLSTPNEAVLRARRRDHPSGRQVRARRDPRPGRDRRLARHADRQRRRQGSRLRPVSRRALQGLPEHHLDERQRLSGLGSDQRPVRDGGSAGDQGH